jgi:phospholipid transport system transporter-binding protein
MAEARISDNGKGRLAIHGELNFASVPGVWAQWQALGQARAGMDIDLSDVQRSDSAGLALLVECLRQAQQTGKSIRFFNIPTQMLAMARVSSLDQVLPLHRD